MKPSDKINGKAVPGDADAADIALHEAETKYKLLFEQSPYGIVVNDIQGNILDFNEKAHNDLGYTRAEFAKLSISDLDPFESSEDVRARIDSILKEGGLSGFEVKHRAKNGELRDVYVITKSFVLSGQTVFHSIWRDTTECKKTEETLRKFADIVQHTRTGITIGAEDGTLGLMNPAFAEMHGYTVDELYGRPITDVYAPQVRALVPEYAGIVHQKGYYKYETLRLRKDGSVFPAEVEAYSIKDEEGKVLYRVANVQDITGRKQIKAYLRKEAERGGILLEMYEKAAHLTEKELYEYVLEQAVRITDSEIGFFHVVSEDQVSVILTTWDRHTLNSCAATCSKHYPIDQAGNWVDCVRQGRPVVYNDYKTSPNRQGMPEGHLPLTRFMSIPVMEREKIRFIVGVGNKSLDYEENDLVQLQIVANELQKIMMRRRTREALRRSEEFIRTILDTVDEGFLVVDRDFRIITANRTYCDWSNRDSRSIAGRFCYEVSHKAQRPCHEQGEDCAVKRVFETGEPCKAMHKHQDSKGNILYVETKAFPLRDASGAVVSVIETVHNITERRLLEEEQLKSQKLEAIGTLAGGIAHDFRNLLQGVFGYISLAKMEMDRQGKSFSGLEQAEKALNLSINLTSQLLTFSKGGKPVKRRTDILPVIENSAKFALSGSRSCYRLTHDEELWSIEADEGQIAQVVQNIVLNAKEAMPDGEAVNISVRNVTSRHPHFPDKPGMGENLSSTDGKFISITIVDSGMGIPQQNISRIFDPYFTTKQKGSGLGLATSYSIIKNHGGLIDVRSGEGKGSTFSIYLPAIGAEKEEFHTPVSRACRKARVLVMDDEEMVRMVAAKMLESIGHEAVCTENGEQAIEKLKQAVSSGESFDVAILDLTVKGGMGGAQVSVKLRELDTNLKIIVSSGYSDNSIISNYQACGFDASLSKPYSIESLSGCLKGLIGN